MPPKEPTTRIPSHVLEAARSRVGLSKAEVGRRLEGKEANYSRYEKNGEVPNRLLEPLAEIIELEITRPPRPKYEIPLEGPEDLRAALSRILEVEERIVDELRELRDELGQAAG